MPGFNYKEEKTPNMGLVSKMKHISGKSKCVLIERVANNFKKVH